MAIVILSLVRLVWGVLSLVAVLWEITKHGRTPFEKPLLHGVINLVLAACFAGGMNPGLNQTAFLVIGYIGSGMGAVGGLLTIIFSFRRK